MSFTPALLDAIEPSAWAAAIYGFIVGVAVTSFARKKRRGRQRGEEISRVAAEMGFSLQRSVLPDSEEELKILPLLARRRRHFTNVLLGYMDRGGEAILFDFAYREGGHTLEQTVAAFRWPAAELPLLHLGAEDGIAISARSELRCIEVTRRRDFTRRYTLCARDEAAARRFFTPDVVAFFEMVETGKEWTVEAGGRYLIVYRPGVVVKAQEMGPFLEETASVAALFHRAAARSTFGR